MTRDVAIPHRCFMCGGYGYLIRWTQPVRYEPVNGRVTYSTVSSIWGTTLRCPACWAAETARLAWLRASRSTP